MTDRIEDGGQAYPAAWGNPEQGGDYVEGMTLRDWFAGQALAGRNESAPTSIIAEWAYEQADAMLEARK